jgi:hypothetical protein
MGPTESKLSFYGKWRQLLSTGIVWKLTGGRLDPRACGAGTRREKAKIRVATAYAGALIKAERKSEWTGMMNLGLPEGDKSHWMGE